MKKDKDKEIFVQPLREKTNNSQQSLHQKLFLKEQSHKIEDLGNACPQDQENAE